MKTHRAVALKKRSIFPKKLNGCNKCAQTRSSYLKKKKLIIIIIPFTTCIWVSMPNFKVRMLWPEGPSIQFYKYRQKLQSQKARPSQSVTLSTLINYVHPLDGYAWRPEVLSGSQLPGPTPPAIRSPHPPSAPSLPPHCLLWADQVCSMMDCPPGPCIPEAAKPGWQEATSGSVWWTAGTSTLEGSLSRGGGGGTTRILFELQGPLPSFFLTTPSAPNSQSPSALFSPP